MRLGLIAFALLFAALSTAPASATVVLSGDHGGKMEDYVARFQQVRDSGDTVMIDGTCYSACTMVLGLVPRNRVCATPNAVLGFHAAWMYDRSGGRIASPAGTSELMKAYPGAVRAWIARNGGLTPDMKFVRGSALAALVKPCDNASRTASTPTWRRAKNTRQAANTDLPRASFDAH
jgi:hypothetical protein